MRVLANYEPHAESEIDFEMMVEAGEIDHITEVTRSDQGVKELWSERPKSASVRRGESEVGEEL